MIDKKEEEKRAVLKLIKKHAKTFSWNLDYSFAEIFLPIMEEYVKNAVTTTEVGWYDMSDFQRRVVFKIGNNKFLRKHFYEYSVKFIKYKNRKVTDRLKAVVDTLSDILKDDDEKYLAKRWNILPLARVKFNHIPVVETNSKGEKETMYRLEVAKGYEEAERYNQKLVIKNNKLYKKRIKWQKKNLHWFVKYLDQLWW